MGANWRVFSQRDGNKWKYWQKRTCRADQELCDGSQHAPAVSDPRNHALSSALHHTNFAVRNGRTSHRARGQAAATRRGMSKSGYSLEIPQPAHVWRKWHLSSAAFRHPNQGEQRQPHCRRGSIIRPCQPQQEIRPRLGRGG